MASKSSLDLEGALVDRAIESVMTLPQEVQQAVTLQRLQNSEITRCEQYLNSMLVGVLAQKLMGTLALKSEVSFSIKNMKKTTKI